MKSVTDILLEANEARMAADPKTLPHEPRPRFQRKRKDAGRARPEHFTPESRARLRLSPGRPVKATPERLAAMKVLRAQGLSHRAIAARLGVSRTAIYEWLRGGL